MWSCLFYVGTLVGKGEVNDGCALFWAQEIEYFGTPKNGKFAVGDVVGSWHQRL